MHLRLLAPFLPYVTEEVWSWWQEGSIHRATWPDSKVDLPTAPHNRELLAVAASMLAGIRGAKSVAKVSQKTEISAVTVRGAQEQLDLLEQALDDIRAAGRVTGEVTLVPDNSLADLAIDASLASTD